MMMAMLAALVETMDPMVMFIPMPGNPYHFVVFLPIARTMRVVGFVSYFDVDLLRSDSDWKNNARGGYRGEPQLYLSYIHTIK
jgi:hypothetical protein